MVSELVLSLFPGIDLLGRAFEEEGFTVVRGPDLLWGGDIKTFHPPSGVWSGVVGGPPCQCFSRLRYLNPKAGLKHGNLIPEYERVVDEARSSWFLMENVPDAPEPVVSGYVVHSILFNNRWAGGEQHRVRRFSFGTRDGRRLIPDCVALESFEWSPAVCASGTSKPGIPTDRAVRAKYLGWKTAAALKLSLAAQGLPDDFLAESPLTIAGKIHAVNNGVPMAMGLAIARGVRRALEVTA